MNNFIEYFYKIHVDSITFEKTYYKISSNEYLYYLYILDEKIDTDYLINIDKELLLNTLINEIIFNYKKEIISTYNNISYILMKIYANEKKRITLEEIAYFDSMLTTNKIKINWGILWSKKIDYLEKLVNENGKKYPIITDSFNYFVGMAENAISYYNNIIINDDYQYFIAHKKIKYNDTVIALYNPLNIIFDYKVRDIAEYIKISFWENKQGILGEINNYLKSNLLSLVDVKLLIARLMYPSFYFDLYEDILVFNQDEKIILKVINKLSEYEKYLVTIINYFKNWYNVEEITWLNNKQ